MPAPCVRDPQVHPAPQSGLPSTGKATACHSDAPPKRRRHPVPGGACAVVATPRHGQCQSSGQLPPADAVKPHHVPAQGCTLQPLPCSPKGTSVSSLPSQPSPALLEGTSASLAPCANIQRTPASVPGSQPCPVPTRGHPTRGYPGSTARRRLQGSGEELRGRHRSGLAQTPPRGAGICSRST